MKNEKDIFKELEELCSSPGYAHALAALTFRDNFIKFGNELSAKDLAHMNSLERLCRTEFSVLLGLMVKGSDYLRHIEPTEVVSMVKKSDQLLQELHQSMLMPFDPIFKDALREGSRENPFKTGIAQRESIFYGAESAFDFQYKEFALNKYRDDDEWFIANKGYSILDAFKIMEAITNLQSEKVVEWLEKMFKLPQEEWTYLPALIFHANEVSEECKLPEDVTKAFLNSLSGPANIDNANFQSIDDFNYTNAYPLIKIDEDKFLCFQGYSVTHAFYETPFFWMNEDKAYRAQASKNRGQFTERFAMSRLQAVFGTHRVFENVSIRKKGKVDLVGEIDVLVLFGNKAIVLQAKSKKLTLQARKGDELALSKDFELSVQDSYDQGLSCTKFLLDQDYELFDVDGNLLKLKSKIDEAYIACIVSDHYPALNFQARNFLKYEDSKQIAPPLVTDVFFLDTLCEMLESPLLFISYLHRRLRYFEQVVANTEFAVLGYHLKNNLWINDKELLMLHDDLATDIDIALTCRRTSAQGRKTPEGILTKVCNVELPLGKLLKQIESNELPSIIEFGLLIFTLSENTIRQINNGIKRICTLTKNDNRQHDFTIAVGDTGITIHSNNGPMQEAMTRLEAHCSLRKYDLKSEKWFGVLLSGAPGCELRNGLKLEYPFEHSDIMESQLTKLPTPQKLQKGKVYDYSGLPRKKLGRNDICSCGSGLKYKKCCM